jgi:hypothetical protein
MLRDARTDGPFAVPPAEVDDTSDGPQAAPPAPPRRRRWPFVVPVAVAVAGVIAWQIASGGPDVPLAVTRAAPPPAVAPAAPPPAPPAALVDAATTFVVVLDTAPTGATLELDGARVGTTPFTLQLAAPREVAARLALDGYAPVTQKLALDRAGTVLVPLVATPAPAPTAGVARVAPPAPPPAHPAAHAKRPQPKTDPFQRFGD